MNDDGFTNEQRTFWNTAIEQAAKMAETRGKDMGEPAVGANIAQNIRTLKRKK